MLKLVFFDVEDYEKEFLRQACEGKYNYTLIHNPLNDLETIPDEIKDADVISCFTTSRVTREVLEQFAQLRLIALRSVGFNHVDTEYCQANGITVENTPNYGNKSVAEFAFGLMLDVTRRISKAYSAFKELNACHKCTTGYELGGKTIGVFGLGAIGREFAKLAYGFEMNILGFDMFENQEMKEKYNVEYVDFGTMLEKSDFISLHAPLTKETYHVFDEEAFKKIKPECVLINTARGELIDTQALYNALSKKEIAGAGLDVLESEEAISDPEYLIDVNRLHGNALKDTVLNNRLLQMDNVIITPHIAYNTHEAIGRILSTTISNIAAFAEGKVQNSVIK
ncbi:MAG: NAD(P)-dependent oxidoreductase [Candidatus Gastranaerophilales bacterium]|nr:NAD(P)-dependent oxidoreductase [Candidatus Gastranaerophilales bacterium]